jgi:hypothetical protein
MAQSAHLWIPGPLPGLNDVMPKLGKGRGFRYMELKAKWTNDIKLLALAARLPPYRRVAIAYRWVELNRKRDPSNIAAGGRKVIEDGLVEAGVLPNDGWKQIAGFSDTFEVGPKPGVEVTLTEIP